MPLLQRRVLRAMTYPVIEPSSTRPKMLPGGDDDAVQMPIGSRWNCPVAVSTSTKLLKSSDVGGARALVVERLLVGLQRS